MESQETGKCQEDDKGNVICPECKSIAECEIYGPSKRLPDRVVICRCLNGHEFKCSRGAPGPSLKPPEETPKKKKGFGP